MLLYYWKIILNLNNCFVITIRSIAFISVLSSCNDVYGIKLFNVSGNWIYRFHRIHYDGLCSNHWFSNRTDFLVKWRRFFHGFKCVHCHLTWMWNTCFACTYAFEQFVLNKLVAFRFKIMFSFIFWMNHLNRNFIHFAVRELHKEEIKLSKFQRRST